MGCLCFGSSTEPLVIDEEIEKIMEKYCLTHKELTTFWNFFVKTDYE